MKRSCLLPGCLLVALLGIVLVLFVSGALPYKPYDSQMIAHFQSRRGDFEELVRMAKADRGTFESIDRDTSSGPGGGYARLSDSRLEQYRHRLRDIGSPAIVWSDDGIVIHYFAVSMMLLRYEAKGYLYTSTPPKDLQADLGGWHMSHQGSRRVDSNWYLFYSYSGG